MNEHRERFVCIVVVVLLYVHSVRTHTRCARRNNLVIGNQFFYILCKRWHEDTTNAHNSTEQTVLCAYTIDVACIWNECRELVFSTAKTNENSFMDDRFGNILKRFFFVATKGKFSAICIPIGNCVWCMLFLLLENFAFYDCRLSIVFGFGWKFFIRRTGRL